MRDVDMDVAIKLELEFAKRDSIVQRLSSETGVPEKERGLLETVLKCINGKILQLSIVDIGNSRQIGVSTLKSNKRKMREIFKEIFSILDIDEANIASMIASNSKDLRSDIKEIYGICIDSVKISRSQTKWAMQLSGFCA